MDLPALLATKTDLLWAGIVSAVVSAAVSYYFKRRETRDTLKAEYEHEQRKRLRELIGRYHGRLVRACFSFSNRLWNLYDNHDKGWLAAGGEYTHPGYYLMTTVYRFLSVCTLARQFESEAIFLDGRIAEPDDFLFMNYLNGFYWALSDVSLFKGLPYDTGHSTDHFFADTLRRLADSSVVNEHFISLQDFEQRLAKERTFDEAFRYFDGIVPQTGLGDAPLRWDRLVIFHFFLASFLDAFAYPTQRPTDDELRRIFSQVRHPETTANTFAALPRLGLGKTPQVRRAKRVLKPS